MTVSVTRNIGEALSTIKLPMKYCWLTIGFMDVDEPGLKEFVEAYEPFTRRLTLSHFHQPAEIQPILSQFHHLEYLEISSRMRLSSPGPIVLENLKSLKISECIVNILEKLEMTRNISEFSITDLKMDGKFAKVAKFLMRCPALKKLTICIEQKEPTNLSEMFAENGLSGKVPFRLKLLDIRGFYSSETKENFSDFLRLHEETLEHLDIHKQLSPMCKELCRQILTRFPKLKTLKFSATCMPDEKSFYICIEPLKSVTDLTVMQIFNSHQTSVAFFVLFPSLEKLAVDPKLRYFSKFLNNFNKFHPKLKSFEYSSFERGTPANLEFKNLQSLTVRDIKCPKAFMNLALSHRKLIEIEIRNVDKLTNENISEIMLLPELRRLELTGTKPEIKRIWDLIKKDYKGLQSTGFAYIISPLLELATWKGVLFPSEKQFWNPQKYEDFFTKPFNIE